MEGRPIEIAELAHLIAEAEPDLDEQGQRLALGVYRRLALGRPVPVGQVAQSVGLSAQRAEEIIGGWPGVYRDAHAEIVGFWGLTIRQLTPTHRISIEGHDLYAWCAWDALFLPGLIGKVARVQSECPTTGETISIEVGPDGVQDRSRPAAVVSFLLPERALDADVIEGFCHFVLFFASQDAGSAWVRDHERTFLLSLGEAFELGRLVNKLNFQ